MLKPPLNLEVDREGVRVARSDMVDQSRSYFAPVETDDEARSPSQSAWR
jgi:hypothetical protein